MRRVVVAVPAVMAVVAMAPGAIAALPVAPYAPADGAVVPLGVLRGTGSEAGGGVGRDLAAAFGVHGLQQAEGVEDLAGTP